MARAKGTDGKCGLSAAAVFPAAAGGGAGEIRRDPGATKPDL